MYCEIIVYMLFLVAIDSREKQKVALARLENIDIFCLSRNSWIDIETIGERNRVFKNNKITQISKKMIKILST